MRSKTKALDDKYESLRPIGVKSPDSLLRKIIFNIRLLFDLPLGTIYRDLRDKLPKYKGRILDIGCGDQPYKSLLPKESIYNGLEIGDCNLKFNNYAKGTIIYDGNYLPFKDNSFNYIICIEVLEHSTDPLFMLSECYRVLESNGELLLTIPFQARWHYIPYDYWRFTPSGLKNIFYKSKFTNVVVSYRGTDITVAWYKLNALIARILLSRTENILLRYIMIMIGLLLAPIFILFSIIGYLSARFKIGSPDDCLGYTVTSEKI